MRNGRTACARGAALKRSGALTSGSGIDIMQVRVARSRLAGDPAEAMVTPMLPDFATMDFHRAAEAIEEGRAAVTRARPMLELMMEA